MVMEPRRSNVKGIGVPEVDSPTAKAKELLEKLPETKGEPSVPTERPQRRINTRNRLLLSLKIKKTTLQAPGGNATSPTRRGKSDWLQILPQPQSVPEDKGAEPSTLCGKGGTKNIAPREVVPLYRPHGRGQGK